MCQLGVEGCKAIANAMTKNHVLTTLRLSTRSHMLHRIDGNKIGTEGTKALSQALLQNHTLTELFICTFSGSIGVGRNGINDEGAKAVANLLAQGSFLRLLDIGTIFDFGITPDYGRAERYPRRRGKGHCRGADFEETPAFFAEYQ